MQDSEIQNRARNIQRIRLEKRTNAFMRIGAKLRAYFFTGILVTAPVAITFYVAYKVIAFLDSAVNRLLPPAYNFESFLPFTIPGLGLVILIVGLILVGMFAAGFLGRFFLYLGEWIVYKLPFVSSIYSVLKQIFETFFSGKAQAFQKVVMLEYPRKGIWILGFVSSDTKGEVKDILKKDFLNIFIPTTPNPTSGFLIFVPKEDVIELNMSVEEGIKFVVSGGLVEPGSEEAQKLLRKKRKAVKKA